MKTTDFIVENEFIGDDAHAMHKDHEVQMAREECYHAARDAIELHKLLKSISEIDGLEGWVSEKIALAANYLNTVREYVEYNQLSQEQEAMPGFAMESAAQQLNDLLSVSEGQHWPDDRNSLSKNDRDIELMNPKDADINWKDRKIATKIKPSITKTTVDRLNRDTTVPNFLKKGVAEDATGGATGAASMGAVVSELGRSATPPTGKPKKIGNIIKRPQVAKVGKGVY
jgi:hypothetical protein